MVISMSRQERYAIHVCPCQSLFWLEIDWCLTIICGLREWFIAPPISTAHFSRLYYQYVMYCHQSTVVRLETDDSWLLSIQSYICLSGGIQIFKDYGMSKCCCSLSLYLHDLSNHHHVKTAVCAWLCFYECICLAVSGRKYVLTKKCVFVRRLTTWPV